MEQSSDKSTNNSAEKEIFKAFPQTSNENFQQFIEILPLSAIVADIDFNFIFVNSAVCEFLQYNQEELTAKNFTDVIYFMEPLSSADVKKQLSNNRENRQDWEFLRKDGTRIWGEVSCRIFPDGSRLCLIYDLTGRKKADKSLLESEEQHFQTQKIEALGRLAGGIAHEFNNFLAVIFLHIDMLNLQLSAESPLWKRINEIKAVSNDAAGVVRQLLAFGRKQPMNPSSLILNQIIKDCSLILETSVGKDINLVLNLEPDLGVCFVDQNQIAQILMNLAINAKDAMPNGGTFLIETANIVLDKKTTRKAQSVGAYVQITVFDTGVGMDSNTKKHIFEPFFSTKESDKGAGLGLAMVYGIVKQSKGFIWVESEINQGTTFKIQFPRTDQPIVKALKQKTFVLNQPGSETVLLVEDEEAVRRLTCEVLRMSGYEVFEASNGMEALEIAQSYNKPIHLLLTDVSMPLMNGREVAEKIRNLHPETFVLFMSGNIGDIISGQDSSEEKAHFLGKPFSPSELTLKVREVLDS